MIKIRDKSVGIWWCDFRTPDGKRVRKSLGTTDKKEAKQLEAKLISESEEKTKRSTGGITLEAAYTHAWRVRKKWIGAKSRHSIDLVYGYVVDYFGADKTLSSIDDEAVIKYGEKLSERSLTASTINKRLSMLSVLFYEAKKSGKYSGHIPNTDHFQVRNGRMRVITPEEEGKVLAILRAKGSPWTLALVDLIIVLADTGARLSEALGIESSRVDFRNGAVLLVDTKNGENRVVPMTDRVREVLTRRGAYGSMFSPLCVDSAERIWARVRAQMGLEHDKEFVLHALRHTFASTLANSGLDSFRLQKVMGHKSITTTQRYVKVSTSALDGIADMVSKRCDHSSDQKAKKEATLKNESNPDSPYKSTDGVQVGYDLKSLGLNRPCRFDSGSGHHGFPSISYSYTISVKGGNNDE